MSKAETRGMTPTESWLWDQLAHQITLRAIGVPKILKGEPLASFGLKALDILALAISAETHFEIQIPDAAIEVQTITIAKLATEIERLRANKGTAA